MPRQQYPHPTVGAIILNPKGEILLIKSCKWRNKYVIPGGHIELGEKMINSLKREIKEEVGLKIYNIKFICFQEFIFDKTFWQKNILSFLILSVKQSLQKSS